MTRRRNVGVVTSPPSVATIGDGLNLRSTGGRRSHQRRPDFTAPPPPLVLHRRRLLLPRRPNVAEHRGDAPPHPAPCTPSSLDCINWRSAASSTSAGTPLPASMWNMAARPVSICSSAAAAARTRGRQQPRLPLAALTTATRGTILASRRHGCPMRSERSFKARPGTGASGALAAAALPSRRSRKAHPAAMASPPERSGEEQ